MYLSQCALTWVELENLLATISKQYPEGPQLTSRLRGTGTDISPLLLMFAPMAPIFAPMAPVCMSLSAMSSEIILDVKCLRALFSPVRLTQLHRTYTWQTVKVFIRRLW